MPLLPSAARLIEPRFTLVRSAWSSQGRMNTAARLRLDRKGFEASVAQVRAWFASQGRGRFSWWVGSSATPDGLIELLLGAGATADEEEPVFAAMVLRSEPSGARDVEIRRVETFADFETMRRIYDEAFAAPEEARAELRGRSAQMWDDIRTAAREVSFLAVLDGEPVAAGSLMLTEAGPALLMGGATLPKARGRGFYRALVRSRWDEAVRRGAPGLAVGAGRMSRPILEQLGFRTVAEIHILLDSSA
jgi:predicted N-acetyltransferase YhbS